MTSAFDSLLNSSAFQKNLNKCLINVLKELSHNYRSFHDYENKLAKYFDDERKKDENYEAFDPIYGNSVDKLSGSRNSNTIRKDLRDQSISECWEIIKDQKDEFCRILEEKINEYNDGLCSYADIAYEFAKKAVNIFLSKISEKARNTDYAQLRQAIDRRKTNNDQSFFRTKTKGSGPKSEFYFSPQEVSEFIKVPDPKIPPKSLLPVNRQIVHTKNNQQVWNGKIVEQEACRFWDACVKEYNAGQPGYVPLYGMYCWIGQSFALGEPQVTSLFAPVTDDDGNDIEYLDTLSVEGEDVENDVDASELYELAKNYVDGLSRDDVRLLTFCFDTDESAPKMQQIAKLLGLSGPSAVSRARDKLVSRVGEYVSQFSYSDGQKIFLRHLWEICRERTSTLSD